MNPGNPSSTISQLSQSERNKIGMKIWQNESGGKVSGLTHWNVGEEFPSMGIGHFIWYPKGFKGPWTESFPRFVNYARQRGSQNIPAWVTNAQHCPWPNRQAFLNDFNGQKLSSLRQYLANNVTLQTDFIIATSESALPKMMAAAPAAQRATIKNNYHKVASTSHGTYALIDYVNFKGDGTNPKERYNNQGWGLMWVLMEMRNVPAGQAAASEFAAAAKRCLDRRIQNSPKARGESRWKAGWHNRCNTYARPL
ncbi:hypothetical protein HW115_00240 [Verrucomicrobiaceae bacterium N1E253]|uniref:Uncharacterized protein n=1 Tax=Oceaniferula marina TaxID=2748318 RepID=A0A851GAM6_9BACT|nr:hypothetical protein [Oceaniferula marina]